MSVTHAHFTIEWRFGCAPRQTFSAFSDPELKRQWFANPGNWPDAVWELDFRVRGGEVNSGGSPGGTHHAFKAGYTTSSRTSGSSSRTTCCRTTGSSRSR